MELERFRQAIGSCSPAYWIEDREGRWEVPGSEYADQHWNPRQSTMLGHASKPQSTLSEICRQPS